MTLLPGFQTQWGGISRCPAGHTTCENDGLDKTRRFLKPHRLSLCLSDLSAYNLPGSLNHLWGNQTGNCLPVETSRGPV